MFIEKTSWAFHPHPRQTSRQDVDPTTTGFARKYPYKKPAITLQWVFHADQLRLTLHFHKI
jgi:hypothetical protein